ncbi:MAG TPA: hypothetical protein P5026_09430 [Kiritimatiellia bacterium]|nr:hypothetical protein [Kiritimatiellia bacterium]HRU70839.1 hypothetical protein [Kiritimatiellia bacterium]
MQWIAACMVFLTTAVVMADTVAYWPMVFDPATGGTSRQIKDATANHYDLAVKLSDAQAVNTSEIPFSRPPNGPPDVTISDCVEINNGTTITTDAFSRGTGTQTQTTDPLILAMGLCGDFTIEGYMYVKSLKHGDGADTIIAFSGMNGNSDWIWNLTEPVTNSNTRQVKVVMRAGSGVENGGVLATINDSDIVGGWHHYALTFRFNEGSNKSRWTFYLDGVNRGSQLMANRTPSSSTQHDRFLLGGANSTLRKVLDAKFAFWRISDVALPSGAMLCYQQLELNTTVAYWPMNVVSAYFNGLTRDIVQDVVDFRNTLMLRDKSYGGVSWLDNNIGWTMPPNPDAELAAAGVDCRSTGMVRSGNNTTLISGQYRQVFSAVSNAPVAEATKLTKSFTVEGYLKFTALPADSTKNQTFLYHTLAEHGGWYWNLFGPDTEGNLSIKVSYVRNSNRLALTLTDSLKAATLLNVWNHYALSFTPDNGKGQTEWRFYLNGRLFGKNNAMPAYDDDDSFTEPKFYISGCPSGGNAQSLRGDMTCWRVSSKALKSTELLCGAAEVPTPPEAALIWKGTENTVWSSGPAENWMDGETAVAWSDGKIAYFDDAHEGDTVTVTGAVEPKAIVVHIDEDLRLDFGNNTGFIGNGYTNFVKRGFGILDLYYNGNQPAQLLKGTAPIEVREGTLKVSAVNSNGGLGDASAGYEVKVYDHARLWFDGRNAIGNATPSVANNSVFTVYTNGTFEMTKTTWQIQALGTLDFLGGTMVFPTRCHALGYLQIRNRLTLGLNPLKTPFIFPAVIADGQTTVLGGITIGRNTEFKVEDITGNAASDGIFNCAVLARTRDGWQTEQNPCGFRKTGAGTMELNGAFLGGSNEQSRPTGVIAIEEGELKINIDYSPPSKYTVATGAFLSGTGKVSTVEFAAGAGLRVDAGLTDLLELSTAEFAGAGMIEVTGVPQTDVENLQLKCAKITGPVTGAANLANWTVKVDGVVRPNIAVRLSDDFLKAAVARGLFFVIQ